MSQGYQVFLFQDDTGSLTSDSEDLEIGNPTGIVADEEELGSDDNF